MNENDILPILIVDDDPANREILSLILSSDNFTVEEANDGVRAVEMAGKKQYQLIIIDIIMPRMNGYDTVKKMREMGITTPIVMQSSLNSKEDIAPAFDAGCNDFITKPYDFNELARILKKYTIQPVAAQPAKTFEHKDRAQQYFDIASVLLVVINADETVALINKKGSEILGYEISEITGKNWFDTFVSEKDREQFRENFYKLISGDIKYVKYFDSSVLVKSGEERIIVWHNTVIRDPSKNIFAVLSSGEDITERRKAEEALRQSEEKYRTLFETMAQGVVYQNAEGYIISANPAAERILGLTFDQMQGKTSVDPKWRAIQQDGSPFPGETHPIIMALKTGKEIRDVIMGVFHQKDNEYRWININAVPQFKQGEDKPYQVYATFDDITERKRVENELQKSEQTYRLLINSIPDTSIHLLDKELRYLFTGGGELEKNKFDKSKIEGKALREAFPKDVVDLFEPLFKKALAGESIAFEMPYGEFKYFQQILHVRDDGGNIFGVMQIATNITERKEAEDSLMALKDYLNNIINAIGDPLFVKDGNSKFVLANNALCDMLGIERENIIGKTLAESLPEDQMEHFLKVDKMVLESGVENQCEEPLTGRNGENLTIITKKTRYINEKGDKFLVGVIHDITERKRLEEQLQIRQRMDSLGTLAGGIAHDFNNLLTGVMGNIDMLKLESEEFSELQKEYLKNAIVSCERAAALIRQFQTLSRSDVSLKTSVDVYEIASEVFNLLEKTTDRLIEKRIDFQPGDFQVTADPSELNQVFMNLGMNALQAIEERGVEKGDYISIRAEDYTISGHDIIRLPEGEYTHILFEDNGVGMSDEVKMKAFDPLFTTKEKGKQKGRGLGLAMVYNIITRKHGGHVAIESAPGKGTTFHIYLPKASARDSVLPEKIKEIAGGNETILVIDDEEMIVNLVKDILEKYGYSILTAPDGRQGMDRYIEKMDSIDLILLDLTMPEMSGRRVFEEMLLINPAAKIIISSGHSEEETRQGILSAAKGHVQKPYKMEQLAQTVRAVLDS